MHLDGCMSDPKIRQLQILLAFRPYTALVAPGAPFGTIRTRPDALSWRMTDDGYRSMVMTQSGPGARKWLVPVYAVSCSTATGLLAQAHLIIFCIASEACALCCPRGKPALRGLGARPRHPDLRRSEDAFVAASLSITQSSGLLLLLAVRRRRRGFERELCRRASRVLIHGPVAFRSRHPSRHVCPPRGERTLEQSPDRKLRELRKRAASLKPDKFLTAYKRGAALACWVNITPAVSRAWARLSSVSDCRGRLSFMHKSFASSSQE